MRRLLQVGRRAHFAMGFVLLASIFGVPREGLGQQPDGADLRLEIGSEPDPADPSVFVFSLTNVGTATAENVVVHSSTPSGTRLASVYLGLEPSPEVRVESPPYYGSGGILIHFGSVPPDDVRTVSIGLFVPDEAGVPITVTASAESDGPESNPGDNTFAYTQTTPHVPSVTSARVLSKPFRLELTGSYLPSDIFSHVLVGCDNASDAMVATIDVIELGGKIIIGGPDLKKRLPKGVPIPIYLFNSEGGVGRFVFTR